MERWACGSIKKTQLNQRIQLKRKQKLSYSLLVLSYLSFVEPPCPAGVWLRAARTPQCHDVITAVGAEPFGPPGGDLSVIQRHPQWDSVVSLHLLKNALFSLAAFTRGEVIHPVVCIWEKRTVGFEWTVTLGGFKTLARHKTPPKEQPLKKKTNNN